MLLSPPFKSLVQYFALELYFNIVFISFYLIKNESILIMARLLLTVARSGFHKKISFYYQSPPIINYKAGTTTSVENRNLIHSSILAGTYSIDDFNTKIKESTLQQRQDWEPPQIKDLKLVIPKDYTFLADNTTFIALSMPDKCLKKTALIRSTLTPRS